MDLLLLVAAVVAAVVGVVAVFWYRKRQAQQAGIRLRQAAIDLRNIESSLKSFVDPGDYIPERVRRPLEVKATGIAEKTLPPMAKVVRRVRDASMRDQFEGVLRQANELRQILNGHNERYVQRMITGNSKLLVEELKADEAQSMAIVRDDERNLVIAGAGSGKTRTIVGRIRFLLERHIPPVGILAVTFTNKATEEMEERLKQMAVPLADGGREGVTVSTLHALGKRTVQATLPGPMSVADDRWTDSLVAAALRDAREARDPKLAQLYVNAILHFHRNEDERAPAVGVDTTYRTLRGEHVRSLGERIIADFLFLHHVPYKYEAKASWADVGTGRGAYHPDFTLLEIAACIEYWGVDRKGEVPTGWGTSSAEYRQGMEWKREQFRRQGKTLLEFCDYERTEGTLEDALQERLSRVRVALRPMTFDELEKVLGDMKYIGSAIERLLVQFLANARSLRLRPDEIRRRLKGATPRVHHFGLLGIAVLERYEAALAAEGRIDFSDMLHRAADILENGVSPLPKFQHILVDEFQDTSAAMARFLKALITANDARLFAVGDDWQAIYGFAGGDVDHIVNFEKHFGPASTTMLNVNYRSPVTIVESGAALIAHNPNQVPKQVVVASKDRGEAYVHEVPDDDYEIVGATVRLIQQERQRVGPDDILVLSRTNHLLGPIIEACRRNRIPIADPDRDVPGVRVLSGHKAKGLESTVVIVVNASDHLLGFPSKVENPDVLEPVRMSTGSEAAEERRLFYVAITRAMNRLHLVARKGLPSPYFAEIEGRGVRGGANPRVIDLSRVRVGARFNGSFHVERLYTLTERQKAAGIRQSGLLSTNVGRFAFTSWASFDLEEGSAYWLGGALKEQPYRDQQRIKLDSRTSIDRQSPAGLGAQRGGVRELRPRPPPALQPQFLK
jgi:DNA helicase-4